MPEIARFLGIIVAMYWKDHAPPHIHAYHNEWEVLIRIEGGHVIEGKFPRKALKRLQDWCKLHELELLENWERAQKRQILRKIKDA